MIIYILIFVFLQNIPNKAEIFWPLDPLPPDDIQLTALGAFGMQRPVRPAIPAHLHTGIDIKRNGGYENDVYIYPIARGKVISKRDDGAYAQLICEHITTNLKFWTVYEHIAGIMVSVGDSIYPQIPVARFMKREELKRYGWQFDHLHLEILRITPAKINAQHDNPQRFYTSYSLEMYSADDLNKYYYSPLEFFDRYIH